MPSTSELQTLLGEFLAEHMIPSGYGGWRSCPCWRAEKVGRAALDAPRIQQTERRTLPLGADDNGEAVAENCVSPLEDHERKRARRFLYARRALVASGAADRERPRGSAKDYQPSGIFPGRITFFLTQQVPYAYSPGPEVGWSPVATDGVEIVDIPEETASTLEERFAQAVCERMRLSIEAH